MTITRDMLLSAIDRITAAMDRDFDMLNSADGALGDGDLGVTMTRGMRAISAMRDELPADMGLALLNCAQAFTKSSGSSYGTLLATGLMSAAKTLRGQTSIPTDGLPDLIAGARDKMQERGKADLGGKTVLDSLDYLARATQASIDSGTGDMAQAALRAANDALDDFRDKPATIGRARIFGEKSVGLDDPGMLAMRSVVAAIAADQNT